MSEGIHSVVLYIHEPSKRFTITARTYRARQREVDEQMARQGYTRRLVAERLQKDEAEELRNRTRTEFEHGGYTYQTRPKLS